MGLLFFYRLQITSMRFILKIKAEARNALLWSVCQRSAAHSVETGRLLQTSGWEDNDEAVKYYY